MTNREIQQALAALGYYTHQIDGILGKESRKAIEAFQRAHGLSVDGIAGTRETQPALGRALAALNHPRAANDDLRSPVLRMFSPAWLPDAVMKGVVVHWTAGTNSVSALDLSHYHFAIDGDARLHRGRHSVAANDARGRAPGYAAHTLNCNTGFIGIALCGMRNAVERPFNAGPSPIRQIQWITLGAAVAEVCERYAIPVTPQTVLSHAEVQANLGIKQRGKWDIARLPWDPSFTTAKAVGDQLRRDVSSHLSKLRSS